MTPNGVLMVIALKPATIAVGAALLVALLSNVVLTVIIKRREARRRRAAIPALPTTRVQQQRIQRATDNSLPDDLQERLRYLTGGEKMPEKDEPGAAAPTMPASGPASIATTAAPMAQNVDDTHFFGDEELARSEDDRTHVFGTAGEDTTHMFGSEADGDATQFFGADADDDSTHFFGADTGDDSTQFFGGEAEGDSTQFFGDEAEGDATAFFGAEAQPRAAHAEREDSTRFFGADDEDEGEMPSGTDFFTAGDLAGVPEAEGTGRLQALPPAPFGMAPGVGEDGIALGLDGFGAPPSTGTLPALPGSPAHGITGALDQVRERLASFSEPRVIALSVLDGSGRVLAGEADDDLTGELRSLMAESGQGNAASVDQAVQLNDNTTGALLLFPTGANALLGALVRDDGDGDATRAHLQGLAHEIGDAMQRAS
jgi:hypothetical protein